MLIGTQKKQVQETSSQKILPPFNRQIFLKQFENLPISEQQKNNYKKSLNKKKTKLRFQYWDSKEVQRVFVLYNQYGSMWKLISSEFVDRAPNSIKNRFYTALRNLLKILFRCHPQIKKIPHQIISKDILKFYHARNEFSQFKGLAFQLLKKMKFGCDRQQAKNICQSYLIEIKAIYDILFSSDKSQNASTQNKMVRQQLSENISQEVQQVQINNSEKPTIKGSQNMPIINPINFPFPDQYLGMQMMVPQMIQFQDISKFWNSGMQPLIYYI